MYQVHRTDTYRMMRRILRKTSWNTGEAWRSMDGVVYPFSMSNSNSIFLQEKKVALFSFSCFLMFSYVLISNI